jgi:pimeloyl-ACP methyl ester carboxylesterase
VYFLNEKHQVRLAGTLTLPHANGPFPAVMLISGAGPQDRNYRVFGHKPFLVLADHLTKLGIAVLRVDDRGVGKSTGSFTEATSQDFADDALAGIEYLKTRSEIAHKKIGLLGHSEGGLIAPMVAARSRDVAFVVMMAGPGLKGDEIVVGAAGADYTGGNKDYTVLKLPNLNHLFQTAETGAISEYEMIEETLAVMALDAVSNWILKHTSGKSTINNACTSKRCTRHEVR